ncbi:MAG: hypothetical protein WBB45_19295 [Cyclobacteriaceae bacterium]
MSNPFSGLKKLIQHVENEVNDLRRDNEYLPGGTDTMQCFYSSMPLVPQGQSPSRLAAWLSNLQPQYNMASMCFYGNLIDDEGHVAAVNSILQQQNKMQNQKGKPANPFLAEWSYCDDKTNGYVNAPFFITKEYTGNVQVQAPYSFVVNGNPLYGGFVSISLVSGEMGRKGAQYSMTGQVVDFDLNMWEYSILLEDMFGTIQVGYGPSSFLPQYLTDAQQKTISQQYGSDVHRYLKESGDSMRGQGSYYYTIPLLGVESFEIRKNLQPYSTGSKGTIWVDYVTQSFDKQSYSILGSAGWQFLAIQFPELNSEKYTSGALMFSSVDQGNGQHLPMARFYADNSEANTTPNGAVKPTYEWAMNDIQFTADKYWTDPSGKGAYKYPVQFTLTLTDGNNKMTIKGNAVRNNQVIEAFHKYEGVFDIKASIELEDLQLPDAKGYAWAEVH